MSWHPIAVQRALVHWIPSQANFVCNNKVSSQETMPHCMAASTLFEPIQQHEAHKSLFNITIATRQSAESGLCVCATLNLTEMALPTCTYLTLLYCRVVPS